MGGDGQKYRAIREAIVSTVETILGWSKSVLKNAVSDLVSDVVKSTVETAISIFVLQRLGFLNLTPSGNGPVNDTPTTTEETTTTTTDPAPIATAQQATPTHQVEATATEVAETATASIQGTSTIVTTGPTTPGPELFPALAGDLLVAFVVLFIIFFVANVASRELT